MGGLDCLGAFDYGTLFKAAGGLTEGIIAEHEADVEKEKLASSERKKLDAVVAADIATSNAQARADVSAQLKSPSASVDAQAAQIAAAAQDAAGAGLSGAIADQRAAAADKGLAAAIKAAQASPKDGYKAALVKAWTATANKAHNVNIVASADAKEKGKKKASWFSRPVLGPLTGTGVIATGAGLGAVGYLVKRMFFR